MIEINQNFSTIIEAANSSERVAGFTHDFYNYPARFSPILAREIIKKFSDPGDLIMDPFMGGGTTLVEAKLLGRTSLGFDISTLSSFLTKTKLNPITKNRYGYFQEWIKKVIRDLNCHKPTARPEEWISNGYQRNLSNHKTWRIRKIIEQFLNAIQISDTSQSEKDFLRCLILKTSQWALDSKKVIPTIDSFRSKLLDNFEKMLNGSEEFWNNCSSANAIAINCSADQVHLYISLFTTPPKLILTSPPYPGIHVVYHRWQIFGSKETPAPFWIANSLDGHGLTHYAMGSRNQKGLKDYFENILKSFKSVRKVCDEKTVIVQVLAFSDINWQLPKYLKTMKKAGFNELLSNDDRIWREVPNRKWYAQQKGKTSSSQEVILFHQLA